MNPASFFHPPARLLWLQNSCSPAACGAKIRRLFDFPNEYPNITNIRSKLSMDDQNGLMNLLDRPMKKALL
jgi:hypothetical protein